MLVTEVFSKSGGNLILKKSPYKFPSLIPEGCRQLGELSPPCILFFSVSPKAYVDCVTASAALSHAAGAGAFADGQCMAVRVGPVPGFQFR